MPAPTTPPAAARPAAIPAPNVAATVSPVAPATVATGRRGCRDFDCPLAFAAFDPSFSEGPLFTPSFLAAMAAKPIAPIASP